MPDIRGAEPNAARRRLLVVAAGGVLVGLGVVGRGGVRGSAATVAAATQPAPTRTLVHVPAPAKPRYYLDDGAKAIALTIDDGPSPVYTPQVLKLLDKYGIRAAFSMIGQNAGYYPGVAREVAAAGHLIVNHTWDHANLTTLDAVAQRDEIARATEAIHRAAGVHPHMFRAPYGAWSRPALEYCAAQKLTPLDWSVDPRDWARPGVRRIVETIMKTTTSGSIILEHDGGGDRSQTVAALKEVIPRLLDEGYRFTTP